MRLISVRSGAGGRAFVLAYSAPGGAGRWRDTRWARSVRARIPRRSLDAIANGATMSASSQRRPSWSPYARSAATIRMDPRRPASPHGPERLVLQFRAETGVGVPLREVMGRRAGNGAQRMVGALVRRTSGHRGGSSRRTPGTARPRTGVDPLVASGRLGREEPEPPHRRVLCTDHRLRPCSPAHLPRRRAAANRRRERPMSGTNSPWDSGPWTGRHVAGLWNVLPAISHRPSVRTREKWLTKSAPW